MPRLGAREQTPALVGCGVALDGLLCSHLSSRGRPKARVRVGPVHRITIASWGSMDRQAAHRRPRGSGAA
eukprot:3490798-Prymnesium_polylepis.1